MLERLATQLLRRLLSYFFEEDTTETTTTTTANHGNAPPSTTIHSSTSSSSSSSHNSNNNSHNSLWSGFVSYSNLRLRVNRINDTFLRGKGLLPIQCKIGHVRNLTLTIPWSKLSSHPVVIVLDGVFLLSTLHLELELDDDEALRNQARTKRRKQLLEGEQTLADQYQHPDPDPDDESCSGARSSAASWRSHSWKAYIKRKLQEGLLPLLAGRVEIHIRDLHVRMEDTVSTTTTNDHPARRQAYALGVILESLHVVQRRCSSSDDDDHDKDDSDKFSQLNHLGVYLNTIEERPYSSAAVGGVGGCETAIMAAWPYAHVLAALDETIARRMSDPNHLCLGKSVNHRQYRRLAHTYLIMPVDGTLRSVFATPAQQQSLSSSSDDPPQPLPMARFNFNIPNVCLELRDVQCLHLLGMYYAINTHKYRRDHYRLHRPLTSIRDGGAAKPWWWYAYRCVCLELRKHHASFQRRFRQRQRYCDLYERKLLMGCSSNAADDAAGLSSSPLNTALRSTTATITTTRSLSSILPTSRSRPSSPVLPLSLLDEQELRDLEDGVQGDLSIQDILLFRIVVHKRIGYHANHPSSTSSKTTNSHGQQDSYVRSWIRRMVVYSTDDETTEQDYQRLVADWQSWTQRHAAAPTAAANNDPTAATQQGLSSPIALAFELTVESGHVALYAPLAATIDQMGVRRLQMKFLDLRFDCFAVHFALMRDFDSMELRVALLDYVASEVRSDQSLHSVVTREGDSASSSETKVEMSALQSSSHIVQLTFSKTPHASDFHMGLQVRVRALHTYLSPKSEWIVKIQSLIRPLPQFEKAKKFWNALTMANINAWMSDQLGLLAKANTLAAEQKKFNIDVRIDCPVIRILGGDDKSLVVNLGHIAFRTEKLAGVVDAAFFDRSSNTFMTKKNRALSYSSPVNKGTKCSDDIKGFMTSTSKQFRRKQSKQSASSRNMASSGESYDVGASVRFADFIDDDNDILPNSHDLPEITDHGVDFYFYDIFELRVESGSLCVEHFDEEAEQVVAPMEISMHIHKSVLPADHTLSRYKIRCFVTEVSIIFSEQSIAFIAVLVSEWSVFFSSNRILHLSAIQMPSHFVIQTEDTETVISTDDSSFNENEFFDAVESDFLATDQLGTMPDKTWITDSESVVDVDTRALVGQQRKRQMSDLSSISDVSTPRKRGGAIGLQQAYYLSAENLARLEEEVEVVGDASVGESGFCTEDSFQSALSIRQIEEIEHDLLEEISNLEHRLEALRRQSSVLRQNKGLDDQMNDDDSQKRVNIRIKLQRTEAELRTVRATLSELSIQKDILLDEHSSSVDGLSLQLATVSLKRASLLAVARRSTRKERYESDFDHMLTQNQKQDSIIFSFAINHVHFRLIFGTILLNEDRAAQVLVSLNQCGAVLRKRSKESRVFVSVESVEGSFVDNDSRKVCFLSAGVNYDVVGLSLPSRFPHFIPPSMEDKLLRCAVEEKLVPVMNGQQRKYVNSRITVGDIEATAIPSMLLCLGRTTDRIRDIIKVDKVNACMENRPWKPQKYLSTMNACVRLSSFRFLFREVKVVAAVAITKTWLRITKSPVLLCGKRAQVGVTCENIQIFCFQDYESGRGSELFGKQDLHSTLLRLRLRYHDVSANDDEGWVSGSSSINVDQSCNRDILYSCVHLGLKIDGISVAIIPSNIIKIGRTIGSLNNLTSLQRKTHQPQSVRPLSMINPPISKPIKWRVDCAMTKSYVFLQDEEEPTELFHVGENLQEKIVLSFSAFVIVQPTKLHHQSFLLQVNVRDATVTKVPGSMFAVESASLCFGVEAPLSSRYPTPSLDPQLRIREDSAWVVTLPSIESRNISIPRCTFAILAKSLDTTIRINPSLLGLISNFVAKLSNALIIARKCHENVSNAPSDGENSDRSLSVAISFDSLSFSIVKDQVSILNAPRFIDVIATFYVEGVMLSLNTSTPSVTCTVDVSYGTVTDFSYRAGTRTLSGGYRMSVEPKSGLSEYAHAPTFLSLKCTTTKSAGQNHIDLKLHIGNIQFLPMPSSFLSFVQFAKDSKSQMASRLNDGFPTSSNERGRALKRLASRPTYEFEVQSGLLLFILSSKDIPKYLRDGSDYSIDVVAFRLKVGVKGVVKLNTLHERDLFDSRELNDVADIETGRYLSTFEIGVSTGLSSNVNLTVSDCQVLRTAITRSPTVPFDFTMRPPLTGEQRITSEFDFRLCHKLEFLSWRNNQESDCSSSFSAAHSLDIQAGFVDILLYVSQSTSGVNEALRISFFPIVKLMKGNRTSAAVPKLANRDVKGSLMTAPAICSIKIDGLMITCVPGGATRLTESPIAKLSLLDLTGGFATVAISCDQQFVSETNVQQSIDNVFVKHIFVGTWMTCNISACYHNRRLVEWEPFVEPWHLEMHAGIDLSRAAKLGPFLGAKLLHGREKNDRIQPQRTNPFDIGGTRLRDIGRLFRSPFQAESNKVLSSDLALPRVIQSGSDLCYLRLILTLSAPISLAVCPRGRFEGNSLLPDENSVRWLSQFGFPIDADRTSKDLIALPSIVCRLSDSMPLNINFTGSLIENLSDFFGAQKDDDSRRLAPHWIVNETGMTIRFQEVLDAERQMRGETSPGVTLSNDFKAPLSLKRSLAQSCDPHTAYILVELGSFEDTVGRIRPSLDVRKGTRSTAFSYKVKKKIPVDTVGVRQYPVDWNADNREHFQGLSEAVSLGWVIVRVSLKCGIKTVTMESPLMLKNSTDADLLCEARDHDGLSLLWRCLIPQVTLNSNEFVSVPVDVANILHGNSYRFSVVALSQKSVFRHESEVAHCDRNMFSRVDIPKPYSRSSLAKGIIHQRNVRLRRLHIQRSMFNSTSDSATFAANVNICSIRIGSISIDDIPCVTSTDSELEIPEQRLLLFRATLSLVNHLALPVRIQLRAKEIRSDSNRLEFDDVLQGKWFDLGIINCGAVVNWTGASSADNIELRMRFEFNEEPLASKVDSWSSVTVVPPDDGSPLYPHTSNPNGFTRLADLKVLDESERPVLVSVGISRGNARDLASSSTNVKSYSMCVPQASRVVAMFVPFWIIDSTGIDLQFKSGPFISGRENRADSVGGNTSSCGSSATLGLGELLHDSDLILLPPLQFFDVFMIGNKASNRLQIRSRSIFSSNASIDASPWSDPFPLTLQIGSFHDINVSCAASLYSKVNGMPGDGKNQSHELLETLALRSSLVQAPARYGGDYGTRFVHVVCRYAVMNELGREIEISGTQSDSRPVLIIPASQPTPLHFNDSSPIRFRPKEIGWAWSRQFFLRRNRRELMISLTHKLKDSKILVTIEVVSKKKAGTCVFVFREAHYAPYRLENRTVFTLQYRQVSSLFDMDKETMNPKQSLVFPYHDVEFAWDEPESYRHSIALSIADLFEVPEHMSRRIGSVRVDRISPGTSFRFQSPHFSGQVISDGPTLVLRITELLQTDLTGKRRDQVEEPQNVNVASDLTWLISTRLVHGIGISLVDWKPQELLYIRLDDIYIEKVHGGATQKFSSSIGQLVVNNQLWVTPYPVMLRVGSHNQRGRHRRHAALSFSWSRRDASEIVDGNTTMFEYIDLSVEPLVAFIDGNVVNMLTAMLRQAKDVGTINAATSDSFSTRDHALCEAVGLSQSITSRNSSLSPKEIFFNDLYNAVDTTATAAVASKLQFNCRTQNGYLYSPALSGGRIDRESNGRRKFYIEKLRISTIAAEICWSGFIPGSASLPEVLRPAFTLEGLPVLLRPLSIAHSYLTTEDHVQILRSHYLSIWRMLDLFVGVMAKPAFLFRAIYFTWKGGLGSFLGSISSGLQTTESLMQRLTAAVEARPKPPSLYWSSVLGPFFKFHLALVHGLVKFTEVGSRLLTGHDGHKRFQGAMVRSRNPRVFANVNGSDLLVPYVEGENAGKAFLSRAAAGVHLGEGYHFHMEGICLSITPAQFSMSNLWLFRDIYGGADTDTDSSSQYILMCTFERVLLLNGRLNASFCDVVWDIHVADIVCVETRSEGRGEYLESSATPQSAGKIAGEETEEEEIDQDEPVDASFVLVIFWLLLENPDAVGPIIRRGNNSDRGSGAAGQGVPVRGDNEHASFIRGHGSTDNNNHAGGRGGLAVLGCRYIFVPNSSVPQLLSRLYATRPEWIDEEDVSLWKIEIPRQ